MQSVRKLLRRKGEGSPQPRREPSEKAKNLGQQAKIHQEQGRLNDAIEAYDDALKEYCDSVGPQDDRSLKIRERLAFLHRDKGDYIRAEAEISAVYTAHKTTHGLWHRSTLRTAVELGDILVHLGRLDKAATTLEETLEAFQDQDDRDCAEKYAAFYSLGKIMAQQGRAEEALTLYHRALPGLERTLGSDHETAVKAKYDLALALTAAGEYVKASNYLEDLVGRVEATRRPGNEDWVRMMGSLGRVYFAMRKIEAAEMTLTRCLEACTDSPLRGQQMAQESATELMSIYSLLGDARAVSTLQAWSRGEKVKLPGLARITLVPKATESENPSVNLSTSGYVSEDDDHFEVSRHIRCIALKRETTHSCRTGIQPGNED